MVVLGVLDLVALQPSRHRGRVAADPHRRLLAGRRPPRRRASLMSMNSTALDPAYRRERPRPRPCRRAKARTYLDRPRSSRPASVPSRICSVRTPSAGRETNSDVSPPGSFWSTSSKPMLVPTRGHRGHGGRKRKSNWHEAAVREHDAARETRMVDRRHDEAVRDERLDLHRVVLAEAAPAVGEHEERVAWRLPGATGRAIAVVGLSGAEVIERFVSAGPIDASLARRAPGDRRHMARAGPRVVDRRIPDLDHELACIVSALREALPTAVIDEVVRDRPDRERAGWGAGAGSTAPAVGEPAQAPVDFEIHPWLPGADELRGTGGDGNRQRRDSPRLDRPGADAERRRW